MAPSSARLLSALCPAGSQAGKHPTCHLGFYTVKWVDWWLVLLGLSFVLVTLYAPNGIGGLIDLLKGKRKETKA